VAGGRVVLPVVVIGAGQSGLAGARALRELDMPGVILEAGDRPAGSWPCYYDSLRAFSPAGYSAMPGMSFSGDPSRYPTRDEVADYLERYAERFELPIRGGTRVERVAPDGEGYLVDTGDGQIAADNVVVATGTFGRPFTPAFAAELDPRITQLHSSEYRRPSLLQAGPVLVVGASHSGADVAMDVAATHCTILAGRDTGQAPVDIESRRGRIVWRVLAFMARRVLTLKTPLGRRMRGEIRSHGGPLLRYRRGDLEAAGVERITARVAGVRDGRPLLDDGTVLDVANVVWCTGFKQDFGWIDLPVCDEDGWPREERGVVPSAPGLYFSGLAFQYAFSSMLLLGAGRDAEHVAEQIAARMAERRVTVAA
jgi:putative flavoprotein involved in K+ transport